jgi:hypothetical protein
MSKHHLCRQWILILLFAWALSACGSQNQATAVEISVDIPCVVVSGETRPLSLRGQLPANAEISWEAMKGSVSPAVGPSTIYRAPTEETDDIITARIKAGETVTIETLSCAIKEQATPTIIVTDKSTPTAEQKEIPDIPSPTIEVEVITVVAPTPKIESEEEFVQPDILSIAITEVMIDPCGESREVETANEYVELYNYGDTPVDVGGWWLMDTGSGGYGQPDEIVAWKTRNPFIQLGADLITDSAIIQPGQYALVLAPLYAASGGIDAPYQIPPNTIILTISQGTRIGDDSGGLLGTVRPRDLLVLYVGTNGQVDEVISTYGTPKSVPSGSNPLDIADDGLDGIPRYTMDCYSVQRLNLVGPDTDSNWDLLLGTPGYSRKP